MTDYVYAVVWDKGYESDAIICSGRKEAIDKARLGWSYLTDREKEEYILYAAAVGKLDEEGVFDMTEFDSFADQACKVDWDYIPNNWGFTEVNNAPAFKEWLDYTLKDSSNFDAWLEDVDEQFSKGNQPLKYDEEEGCSYGTFVYEVAPFYTVSGNPETYWLQVEEYWDDEHDQLDKLIYTF